MKFPILAASLLYLDEGSPGQSMKTSLHDIHTFQLSSHNDEKIIGDIVPV
jgi:hypothetical protein